MRRRGLCHVDLNVPEYDAALSFYDRMFGWLGYLSFGTLGIAGCHGTYYVAFPHSYIGIQPASDDERPRHELRLTGINHIALWAHSRTEVREFHRDFLLPESLVVLDPPDYCPEYSPHYFAVFFLDPYGIRWELAHVPLFPSPLATVKWWRLLAAIGKRHPEWNRHPFFESLRPLPGRHRIK
jgi:catechol 2,3-dioxygenase-like lactoylglutathione lyase family enzyme